MLDHFVHDLDEFMDGRDLTVQEARACLVGLTQRVDALQVLGPPSREALQRLLAEQM